VPKCRSAEVPKCRSAEVPKCRNYTEPCPKGKVFLTRNIFGPTTAHRNPSDRNTTIQNKASSIILRRKICSMEKPLTDVSNMPCLGCAGQAPPWRRGSGGLPPAHCIGLRAMLKCALAVLPAPVNPQSGRHSPSATHGGKPRGRDFATPWAESHDAE
jgi:hypothetical protein